MVSLRGARVVSLISWSDTPRRALATIADVAREWRPASKWIPNVSLLREEIQRRRAALRFLERTLNAVIKLNPKWR